MKKYTHLGVGLALLSTIPSFAIHAQSTAPIHIELPPEWTGASPFIQRLFTEDNLLSYDAVLELIDAIENDRLGPCSPEDERQIGEFIAYLARQGVLPGASEIEKAEQEYDISEMLSPQSPLEQASYWLDSQEYSLSPAVYYYGDANVILCHGWWHKQWKNVKHFVHEHKVAVIVGSVLVVAAVVVVATVVAGSVAAAATAASAAGAASGSKEKEAKAPEPIPQQTTVSEQVSNLRATADANNLLPTTPAAPDPEQARALGAALAHEAVQALPCPSNPYSHSESPTIAGHGVVDQVFSTNQAPSYLSPQSCSTSLPCNMFMAQGEQALKVGDYEQAVEHFGKAIDADPKNNEAYLQRAYAYMGADELLHALSDYRTYNANEPALRSSSELVNSVDFGVGFVVGLPKGAVESGRQLVTFASELAKHPIDTSCQVCDSFGALAKITYSRDWETLRQALAPEICDLVEKWNTLSPREQGERAGYVFGKYSCDIFAPGAAAKMLATGLSEAKEVIAIAKNLQRADEMFALDALSRSVQDTGSIPKIKVQARPSSEKFLEMNEEAVTSHFIKELCPSEIALLEAQISKWLGEEVKYIRNPAGDPVFVSNDGLRKVRFDFNRPHPHENPHMHFEQLVNGEWQEVSRIYPSDVPQS